MLGSVELLDGSGRSFSPRGSTKRFPDSIRAVCSSCQSGVRSARKHARKIRRRLDWVWATMDRARLCALADCLGTRFYPKGAYDPPKARRPTSSTPEEDHPQPRRPVAEMLPKAAEEPLTEATHPKRTERTAEGRNTDRTLHSASRLRSCRSVRSGSSSLHQVLLSLRRCRGGLERNHDLVLDFRHAGS